MTKRFNIALIGGFASGNFVGGIEEESLGLLNDFKEFADFSGVYFGISVGIQDRIFYPNEIRYNK